MRTTKLGLVLALALCSAPAWAGKGSSAAAIQAAVQSGSVDSIVAELERAEHLPSAGAIALVLPLVDHDSWRVRDAAGWWLARRGVKTQVIADMSARLSGSDPVAARNAGDVLAAMRDYTTVPALQAYLQKPLDEDSGVAVARALGTIGHPSGQAALEGALASSLAGVRAQAAASLRDLRAPRGSKVAARTAALLPLVGDSDANVRRQALLSIGFVAQAGGDISGATAALTPIVTSDSSPVVRKAAAWALGQMRDGNARAALSQAQANDSDPLVRSIASAALANLR